MTETSRPFSGTSPGDSGPYSSTQWQQLYQYIIGLGASRANVGPFLGSGTQPNRALNVQAQSPATTSVDVLPGSALVQGIAYINTATVSFAIAANASGNPRVDTVVVRADYALQTVRLAVSQGTPAATPSPPTLTQSAGILWEIPIADIAVANGFTSIADTNITPRHEYANAANGVYLDNVLNNSGGTLVTGDVVIWDTTTDRAITTTTTFNHPLIAGVWVGRTANGGYGRVQVQGIGLVQVNGTYARGTGLYTSTTAKQAGSQATGVQNGTLGILLEASTGAAQLKSIALNVQRRKNAVARYSQQLTSGTTGTAYAINDNTVVLNTEDSDTSSIGSLAANQVTIQPGIYYVTGRVSFGANTTRVARATVNIAGGAVVLTGNNVQTVGATAPVLEAVVSGPLEVTAPTTYELHIRCSGAMVAPAALTSGTNEYYASLEFVRIDQ